MEDCVKLGVFGVDDSNLRELSQIVMGFTIVNSCDIWSHKVEIVFIKERMETEIVSQVVEDLELLLMLVAKIDRD